MKNFDDNQLIDLDECVVNALKLFQVKKPPVLDFTYKKPLVVGSGNAAVTGRIIFEDLDAIFADEGTYEKKINTIKDIDGAVLISASGGKHAPIIAKALKEKQIPVSLLTCNKNARAKDIINKILVTPNNPEPYTYNTSTYMGMILSKTNEDPKKILSFIKEKVDPLIPNNFNEFDAYYLIVPAEFDNTRELFMTKFDELFGPKILGRVFTPEQTKHAKTVIKSETEMFIGFGYQNKIFGTKRLNIPLPKSAGPVAVMAIGYYVIGKIQKQNEPYFKNSIEQYIKDISEVFGYELKVIVE